MTRYIDTMTSKNHFSYYTYMMRVICMYRCPHCNGTGDNVATGHTPPWFANHCVGCTNGFGYGVDSNHLIELLMKIYKNFMENNNET